MPDHDKRQPFEDIYFTTRDGLRLYGRRYPSASPQRLPALCLPGLTRNSRDFHDLAVTLSQGPAGRDIYTIDYRGRGLSDSDRNWRNYALQIEALDALDFLACCGLERVAVIGTSRGGLLAHVLAAMQPTVLGPVVLNDIGPVIEIDGLTRIAGYVGRTPVPTSWPAATALVAEFSRRAFPAVPEEQWAEVARQWFNDRDGKPQAGYDAKLGRTLSVAKGPPPPLWPQFAGLTRQPMLVIRGETSDLLSAATVAEMQRRHPDCAVVTIPGQGHAPLLKDAASQGTIGRFLALAEAGHSVAGLKLVAAA